MIRRKRYLKRLLAAALAVFISSSLLAAIHSIRGEELGKYDLPSADIRIRSVEENGEEDFQISGELEAVLRVEDLCDGIASVSYTVETDGLIWAYDYPVGETPPREAADPDYSRYETGDYREWDLVWDSDGRIVSMTRSIRLCSEEEASIFLTFTNAKGNGFSCRQEIVPVPANQQILEGGGMYLSEGAKEPEEIYDRETESEQAETAVQETFLSEEEAEVPLTEETEPESGLEPETESAAEPEPEPESEPEPEPEEESSSEPESVEEAVSEPEEEPSSEPESVEEAVSEPEAESASEPEPVSEPVIEIVSEPEPEPEPESVPEAEPQPQAPVMQSYEAPVYYYPQYSAAPVPSYRNSYTPPPASYPSEDSSNVPGNRLQSPGTDDTDTASAGPGHETIPEGDSTGDEKLTEAGSGETEMTAEEAEQKEAETGDDKEKASEKKINTEGSAYDISEIEDLMGQCCQEVPDLVIYENNADTIDPETVKVLVSRNQETFELEKDSDYTVKLTGLSEELKTYKYVIHRSVFAEEGNYRVFLFSEDAFGNFNSSEGKDTPIWFTVDVSSPLILSCDNTTDQEELHVREVRVKDNTGLSSVDIYLGDQKMDYEVEGETYRFHVPEDIGPSDVKVVASDEAGNTFERILPEYVMAGKPKMRSADTAPVIIITAAAAAAAVSIIVIRKKRKRRT